MTDHRSRRRWTAAGLAVCLAAAVAGCGSDNLPAGDREVTIVATTTILGDVARRVAADDAVVEVLLPLGADPHDYRASARQVAAMRSADLVIANGLDLEEGLLDVLEGLEADGANVLRLAPLLSPIPFAGGGLDPHVWFDPLRMADAAGLIAGELQDLQPASDWTGRADAYAAELAGTDLDITGLLSSVPADQRSLVTNHDSLGYLADRYGYEVVGTVIPGGSTLAEPSSAALTELVGIIDSSGVAAIFAETTDNADLADAIAAEIDREVAVIELYTGSLGEPGSGADTLIGMLLTNARRVTQALDGSPSGGSAAATVGGTWTG
ncbi:MAG: metal ABC transporter solute-binding protein, Zn/Mn family [Acidimicrobiia bacterium]